MPWKAFKRGETWQVYKLDGTGEPVGDALGTHETEAEASAQIRALYANEPDAKAVKFAAGSATDIEGWLAPWGGAFNGRDVAGEFFSQNTDFVLDWFPAERPLIWHHGLDAKTGPSVIGRIKTVSKADLGLWMQAQLDAHHEYYSAIKELIDQGKLGLSSGSMRHLVEVNKKTGEILRWPLIEGSLTPTPANPLAEVAFAEAKSHFKAIGIELADDVLACKIIRKEGDKWVLYSHDGSKKLGEFDTEEAAKEREREIQFFKHQKAAATDDDDYEDDVPDLGDWEPTDDDILNAIRVLAELGLVSEEDQKSVKAKGGRRGNVGVLISSFGRWASGKHTSCVSRLSGKEGISNPAKLCAWLKDRYTGTTKWRGKHKKAIDLKLSSADMPEQPDEGHMVEKKATPTDVSDDDQQVLETLEEHLNVLTGFSDDEIAELSQEDLDGLIALCDEFIDEEAKAGGHGGHGGAHGGHGGGSSMGPMAKKGARKRVMGKLNTRRSQVLADIRNMRTMKLTSPRSAELRKEMIGGAQTELSGIRKKMVTARAKYKSSAIKMCSWEDVRQEASHMIEQQLAAAVPFGDQPGYCYVEATYSDHLVCCICKAGLERHYSVPFELDDDGHVAKLGSPTEVEKGDWKPVEHPMENIPMGLHASMAKTYVSSLLERTKDLLERRTKEGRVLSTATRKRLMECSQAMRGACEEIDTLLASTEPPAKAGEVQLRLKVLKLFAATL